MWSGHIGVRLGRGLVIYSPETGVNEGPGINSNTLFIFQTIVEMPIDVLGIFENF